MTMLDRHEAAKPPRPCGENATCPIERALRVIGDRWTFLILRDALAGTQSFERWHRDLGIARNVLAHRLTQLVAFGLMRRVRCPQDGRRYIYVLTPAGAAAQGVIHALAEWSRHTVGGSAAQH